MSRKYEFHSNLSRISGTLLENFSTFLIISRSILLIIRNLYETKVIEKIKIHILCSKYVFRKSRRLYNVEKYGTSRQAKDYNIKGCMRLACWITKATETHSEYVILLPFAQQQCLLKPAFSATFICIACLVECCVGKCITVQIVIQNKEIVWAELRIF